jgi:hypothetical protein
MAGGTLWVIAGVSQQVAIQAILLHLKQRAPPAAARRQRPAQKPHNDLFPAI